MGDTMSSLLLGGLTSGTIELKPADVAGTNVINVPATTGTMVTTGDVGTVTKTMLAGSSEFGLPVGAVIHVAMTSAPSGYLKANGAAVSRTTYADLFAAIGTTFGSGDGSTTFNLPDLRGEFVRGWDDSRGVDSGRLMGTSQKGTLTVSDPNYSSFNVTSLIGRSNYTGGTGSPAGTTTDPTFPNEAGQDLVTRSQYPNVLNSYISHANAPLELGSNGFSYGATRPRNVSLLACIKF
jgi:phage-related tail fiber protein